MKRLWYALAVPVLFATASLVTATNAQAATGCRVEYSVSNQWPGGFGAAVTVTNLGDPVSGWRLTWSFAAGQAITQLWNGSYTQSGAQVTVTNAAWNGNLATGGAANIGFNGSWTGSNPAPAAFALNGVACTGAVGGSPSASPTRSPSGSPSASPSTSPSTSPQPGTS